MVKNDVFGTDIDSSWSFVDGDIQLSRGKENLGQAISNRLNSDDDQYSDFYIRYGGRLFEHFGDLNHPTIHEYIRIEIESILGQEPRIKEINECTVNKINSNTVECNLKVTPIGSDEVIDLNLVLSEDSPIFISSNNEMAERI